MMIFDLEQNRIPSGFLTEDELAALRAAKHGWLKYMDGRWVETLVPLWHANTIYRAKPAPAPTILVNGIEVPEPVREELEEGQWYWLADPTSMLPSGRRWVECDVDICWLNRGLIHLTEEAAVAHAKAMLAPSMLGDV